ncbi:M20/M25/M40 family metallo-hydrolase [Hymenobacter sp. PAMC 26628]|uniref:M20/M25/M40 family metallo-hydrolase n=1 Tax=Hymenobacter sp. PAMC 26628 TaxID=1484118 RepID=UPI0012FF9571|nr:M20/M25/M40 family metallo-hydrolase [Hymenobacter sp. PAMC 26628]
MVTLIGLLLFAVLYLARAPRPVPAGAPATAFSAEQALREVAVVARVPHSIGTPANAAVRDYLLRRCRALGLTATVQDTTVVVAGGPGTLTGARVQNVVARLRGRLPGGPAVLVLTHYDSQPHTPGASDDGAGVAAALETIRALRAGPLLAHDVRWVFTDGEEMGLLGAQYDFIPPSAYDYMHQQMPHSQVYICSNGSHFAM